MKAEINLFACIDHNGDYAVGTTEEAAREAYTNEIGDLAELDGGYRIVKVKVNVPLPVMIECEATIEEEEPAEALAA